MLLDEEDFQRYLREEYDPEDEFDPIPVTEVYQIEDYPGTGVDCDDCGFTSDRLEYREYADGSYTLTMSYGCTGGGYLVHQLPAVGLKLLEDHRNLFASKIVAKIRKRLNALNVK